MANYCPNCGTELQGSIEGFVPGSDDTIEIKPEGGVLVCPGCGMASTAGESAEHPATESPPGEDSPRGAPDPPREEDGIRPEGEDFEPAPTTSPEVPLEEAEEDAPPDEAPRPEQEVHEAEFKRLVESGMDADEARVRVYGE